jgi:hypothetical protein
VNARLSINTTGALLQGQAGAVIQRNLDGLVDEATMFLTAEVKKRTPQGVSGAQGGLLGSIIGEVFNKGTALVKGLVMTANKYAEVIEKGRRPGKGVPHDALLDWIRVKLGITDPKELERVNYLIRWKIYQKGFAGAHMFEKALTENTAILEAMATRRGMMITQELN